MTWPGRLHPAITLCAVALAGCGDSGEEGEPGAAATGTTVSATVAGSGQPRPLSPAEAEVIARARDAVSAYCRKVGQGLGGGKGPTPADFETAIAALDQLAELAARAPGASAADGTTPRLALGDLAEDLEGTNCDARLVAHIDEALSTLPAE